MTDPPIEPPATIGILGGGQLGRMLAQAGHAMGYRFIALDPDPDCPASVVVDDLVVAGYDDVVAARRLAETASVVTYELEHVDAELVRDLAHRVPVRPGLRPLRVTQDRLSERRFLDAAGARVAPWRAVESRAALDVAARSLGAPLRLKAAFGGYDGRSQVRVPTATAADLDAAWAVLAPADGRPLVLERELDFAFECSVVCARAVDGSTRAYTATRNRHDEGILVESTAPAPLPAAVADEAARLATALAAGLEVVGMLTVELFLLADGSLVVNELAPRVHNSGHWTIEGARTSQFEQHLRAICGLPLGPVEMSSGGAAMVNLLGTGTRRAARAVGADPVVGDAGVAVHVYGKREVFERRKMGHVTARGPTPDAALAAARRVAGSVSWADDTSDAIAPGREGRAARA